MKFVVIMHGAPGSGKSTLAKSLLDNLPNTLLLSRDEIRFFLQAYGEGGIDFKEENEYLVHQFFWQALKERLPLPRDLIIDECFESKEEIFLIKKFCNKFNRHLIIVNMRTPYFDCHTRNRNRQRTVPDKVLHKIYVQCEHNNYFFSQKIGLGKEWDVSNVTLFQLGEIHGISDVQRFLYKMQLEDEINE